MRSLLFTIGFISMMIKGVNGSALMDDKENAETENRIFQNINCKNLNPSTLGEREKEWLYETDLLKSLQESSESDRTDMSRTLNELALFYEHKQRPDLANKRIEQKAQLDLEEALKGSSDILGDLDFLVREKVLDEEFIQAITQQSLKLNDSSGERLKVFFH